MGIYATRWIHCNIRMRWGTIGWHEMLHYMRKLSKPLQRICRSPNSKRKQTFMNCLKEITRYKIYSVITHFWSMDFSFICILQQLQTICILPHYNVEEKYLKKETTIPSIRIIFITKSRAQEYK